MFYCVGAFAVCKTVGSAFIFVVEIDFTKRIINHKNHTIMSEEMNHNGVSAYEAFKMSEMSRRNKVSGTGIAGLATGAVALFLAGAGWVYAHSQAKRAQEVAAAKNEGTAALLNQTAALLANERAERVAGDLNITNTINDTVSGSQQGSLSQSQQLSNELTFGLMTGRYSENPQRVALYQDARPCACPASGCGCN